MCRRMQFETAAEAALRADADAHDAVSLAERALELCPGDLLPDDLYEPWLDARRERVRSLRIDLLRRCRRWDDILAIDPIDEDAHIQLMRELAARGDHLGALRQYERLDRELNRELGVAPSRIATALRDEILARPVAGAASAATATDDGDDEGDGGDELVGRDSERALIATMFDDVARSHSRTLVLSGAPGFGKSELLRWIRRATVARGWRCGGGVAAAIEGAWPYAPVLEAINELCRTHPTLLDALDDNYRVEIERALAGTDLGWNGDGGHQRVFVAVGELVRVAASDRPVVLLFDDVHEADEGSLRLIHYLARCATSEQIAVVVAHRSGPLAPIFERVRAGLVGRAGALTIDLQALDARSAANLVRRVRPSATEDDVTRIVDVAGGCPFALVELARRDPPTSWERSAELVVLARLDPTTRDLLQRVAALGAVFDTDEFVAIAGIPDDDAFVHLDRALDAGIIEHTGTNYRFRHGLLRDALIADVAPHRRRRIHRHAADRLLELGASPARVGHHLCEAGDPGAAGPFLVRAAEREAAIGAYRDALNQIDRVLAHVDGVLRARALALRADLLFAIGDATAPTAYRHALEVAAPGTERLLLARLARAAMIDNDIETARAALASVELDGGDADGDILLARGLVAYLGGDLDAAWDAIEAARQRVLRGDKSWKVLDLIALEGLLAHTRGDWFDRMRAELQRMQDSPDFTLAIFDGYLCPAEYLLYGRTPHHEVVAIAHSLRETARRAGALRAVAFAAALAGEANLLAGDLDAAERELEEAIDLHRDIGAAAGESHSLQRLAEVKLARGDRDGAMRLLQRALPLARWSALSLHLLQRVYGTMILAAPDADTARSIVDRAESALGTEDRCQFCDIMLAVPATMACASVGDIEHARRHLAMAEASVHLWESSSWQASVLEARAHLARAEGDIDGATKLLDEAAVLFAEAGQPLDEVRCRVGALNWPQPQPH